MPRDIQNHDLYQDRTVQDWHRESFPADHWAIDLDLMGACRRCRQPLYLIESTTNPNKPSSILLRLAQRADIPAFVIYHDTEHITSAKRIYPSHKIYGDAIQVQMALVVARLMHMNDHHAEVGR